MVVGATRLESHAALPEVARFALDSTQLFSALENEVVSAVLAKRHEKGEAEFL
jgi:hypothetical protein